MILKIDFESETPIYEQLRRQIIHGIASGKLEKGESLPSVRQMAEDIGINLHTVNKAYNILKSEGYLNIDRRSGAVVSSVFPRNTEEFNEKLKDELQYIVSEVYCRGITKDEFLKLSASIFEQYD